MIRKGFVMFVTPGFEEEYERRHCTVDPELLDVLRQHGVHNYSIFLHPETRQLFGYLECEDEARLAAIAETQACKKWWARMKEIMPSNPDNSPVQQSLREVFHLH